MHTYRLLRKKLIISLSLLLLLKSLPVSAVTLVGKIVSVAAGDTVTLRDINGRKHKIHLYGITCPKKGQPFAKEAGKHTAKLVAKKKIMVRVYSKDRLGDMTGLVFADDKLVNESLIKNGLAWQYRDKCSESFCKAWLRFEEKARARKIGLWKHKDPVPPWQ